MIDRRSGDNDGQSPGAVPAESTNKRRFTAESIDLRPIKEAFVSTSTTKKTAVQARRERAVEEAIHSGEMEGLSVSGAFEADAADYARGAIDLDEFGRRVRARNGVA